MALKKIDEKFFDIFWNFIFLVSCGNIGKALKNEKIISTDEFLVKKRGPLILPPDYEEIPTPDSIIKKEKESQQNKIEKMLKAPKKESKTKTNSTSLEQSILEKIQR